MTSKGGGATVTPAPITKLDLGTTKELFDSDSSIQYILTIKVQASGLAHAFHEILIAQLALKRLQGATVNPVGHTWVQLSHRGTTLPPKYAGGHTGEEGKDMSLPASERPRSRFGGHHSGMMILSGMSPTATSPIPTKPEADPANPIRWLHYIFQDGRWLEQASDTHHECTQERSFALTATQYAAAKSAIDRVSDPRFTKFYGLTGNQCTSTANIVATAAGITLDPFVNWKLHSSYSLAWTGLRYPSFRAYSDPTYANLKFAFPDKMADQLKSYTSGTMKSRFKSR